MFKKLFLPCALSLVSLSALAMPMPDAYTANLTIQLNHVNSQINAAKRAWKESLLRMAIAKKAAPNLYPTVKQIFETIINSPAFTTQMNTAVDQQFESIVNNNASFRDVKTENNLSDFSAKQMSAFAQQLYTAMANKAYYFLLGKKLAEKSKELATTIRAAQQANTSHEDIFAGLSS
jgi:hypothetical protein